MILYYRKEIEMEKKDTLVVMFRSATLDPDEDMTTDQQREQLVESAAEDIEENIYEIEADNPNYFKVQKLVKKLEKLLNGNAIG
jgi:vacuolar-type H+-ATPase subunit E/Vma4